ncbi:hypothetical protein NFI96_010002, partial [Prochilodus magdalenae]
MCVVFFAFCTASAGIGSTTPTDLGQTAVRTLDELLSTLMVLTLDSDETPNQVLNMMLKKVRFQDAHVLEEVTDNTEDMDHVNRNHTELGRQTHQVLQSTPLDLIETGKGLKVQAERPHLVSLGSGRLSTAITLLPLPEGTTTLGHGAMDINIQGPGVAAQHCFIENKAGVITLHPCGNQCSIDGLPVTKPIRLSQGDWAVDQSVGSTRTLDINCSCALEKAHADPGSSALQGNVVPLPVYAWQEKRIPNQLEALKGCMLCFGQSSFFRFNHPEEAFRMKSMRTEGQHTSSTMIRVRTEEQNAAVGPAPRAAPAVRHISTADRGRAGLIGAVAEPERTQPGYSRTAAPLCLGTVRPALANAGGPIKNGGPRGLTLRSLIAAIASGLTIHMNRVSSLGSFPSLGLHGLGIWEAKRELTVLYIICEELQWRAFCNEDTDMRFVVIHSETEPGLLTYSESLVNGNHQSEETHLVPKERVRPEHSTIVSSIEKDLQDIMDSLVMDDPQPSSSSELKKPSGPPGSQSPLSPLLNGGGRYLLSPPTSPGAMSVGSSYENTSPPFSPLSSPSAASSGSFTSPSPSGCPDQISSLPPVPVRSSSYNYTSQPPVPQPRTMLPNHSGSQKVPESPRLQRRALLEAPPSPKLTRRGLSQDNSTGKAPDSPRLAPSMPFVSISAVSNDVPSLGRIVVPGSPKPTPKFTTTSPCSSPSSPRLKMANSLHDRPSSPFCEQPQLDHSPTSSPSQQLSPPPRAFQPPLDPIIHIIQPQPQPRNLQPPESPRLARRNLETGSGNSMRELPPLSPSVARRGVPVLPGALPGTLRTPESPSTKVVPDSPRLRRKAASPTEELFSPRLVRARSPSPTSSLLEGSSGRKGSFGNALSPAFSLGSLPGSSPLASPRSRRKMSAGHRDFRLAHPGMRERKNSITEISDNEDELLEYHRRQREERLREQEMERLVSAMRDLIQSWVIVIPDSERAEECKRRGQVAWPLVCCALIDSLKAKADPKRISPQVSSLTWQKQDWIRSPPPSPLTLLLCVQERQRLETILNLCAEYNKGDDPAMGFSGLVSGEAAGIRRPSMDTAASTSLRLAARQRETDEENVREECSSTESTHQEVRTTHALLNGDNAQVEDSVVSGGGSTLELEYLEEERVRVLARFDELKARVTELEQQLQESKQEAEMERALLQGEKEAELEQIEAETEIISQLQHKLSELENAIQREKDK